MRLALTHPCSLEAGQRWTFFCPGHFSAAQQFPMAAAVNETSPMAYDDAIRVRTNDAIASATAGANRRATQ